MIQAAVLTISDSAHAGTRPEYGRSAIRELGNIIQTLEAMNDPKRGVTVNLKAMR